MRYLLIAVLSSLALLRAQAQDRQPFDGIDTHMGNLFLLSDAETRSIGPENPTGEKGKGGMATEGTGAPSARELGQGWKINPCVPIKAGQTYTLAEITGSGAIQHIWLTPNSNWRYQILRFYWDDEKDPSVEVPLGDFFAMGWGEYAPVNSLAVTVNPGSGLNCYWTMPFRKKCRITLENIGNETATLFYQIDYVLGQVPANAGYFHAQFRRSNPTKGSVYTLVDGIKGKGQYVGTYIAWGQHNNGWWGEGEIKFYMDGDKGFPTINGTGTEDYFCGSYGFLNPRSKQYETYTTAYAGFLQVIHPSGVFDAQTRFGLYRWHIKDPVRFSKDLKVTMQDLGWRDNGRYLQQQSDISSVVYWYQDEPHAPFPKLPSRDELEIY
jgi:hypothetical protein